MLLFEYAVIHSKYYGNMPHNIFQSPTEKSTPTSRPGQPPFESPSHIEKQYTAHFWIQDFNYELLDLAVR